MAKIGTLKRRPPRVRPGGQLVDVGGRPVQNITTPAYQGKGPASRPGSTPPEKPKPQAQPAAPQGPQGRAPEFDEQYFREVNRADTRGAEDLSRIAGQRQRTIHEFGIDDPTSPFSRSEGLKRAFLNRRKSQSANIASQGQLYSGTHEATLRNTRFSEEQSFDELRTLYQDALNALTEEERQARYGVEDAKDAAYRDWLDRAPEADVGDEPLPDTPGKPKPQAQKPAGKPKPKSKKKAPKKPKPKAVM